MKLCMCCFAVTGWYIVQVRGAWQVWPVCWKSGNGFRRSINKARRIL